MASRKYFEDFEIGDEFESRGRTVTEADIRMFIGATGADHPNHTDAEYCRTHPIFRQPCAPGVLALSVVDGFIADEITRKCAVVLNYGHDRIRYLRPVYPGDTLRAKIRVAGRSEKNGRWGVLTLEAHAHNQRGELVLVNVNKLLIQRQAAGADPTGVATSAPGAR